MATGRRVLPTPADCGAEQPGPSFADEIRKGGPMVRGRLLAQVLGLHERTIRDLVDKKIIPRATSEGYPMATCVAAYCAHEREVAAGRGGASGVSTLTAERARLAREQADAAALKNAALRGDLVDAAAVERTWTATLAAVRARFLSVPSRFLACAPHLTRADGEALDAEIRLALEEAANG